MYFLSSIFFVLINLLITNILSASAPKDCVTSFGLELGNNEGVIGYSNCRDDHYSDQTLINEHYKIPSGLKWQCVEYARRYYQEKFATTFHDVEGASDIWDLEFVWNLRENKTHSFISCPNKISNRSPEVHDVIIYQKSNHLPYGHVAVVVDVDKDLQLVFIAEQNWENDVWQHPNYSRVLKLTKDPLGVFELKDDSGFEIIGWKYFLKES
jgi:hypothetical protein